MACKHGSLEVIKLLLLEHHADVHKQFKVKYATCIYLNVHVCMWNGGTACNACAYSACLITVVHFCFVMDKDGSFIWTPLMMAARAGHYQICRLLLEHGAVLDLPQEVSVLHSAGM